MLGAAQAGSVGQGHRMSRNTYQPRNTVRDLNYQLKQLCQRNRDGSYATQQNRERLLSLMADQLNMLGYRGLRAQSLKPKHVEALVTKWRQEELSVGTVKNRMAALRWWAQKVDRRNVIARSNDHYGIPERRFVASESKAQQVGEADLERVRDPHVRMSLELQQAFGLRREEAIKFRPSYADRGDRLVLKDTWTKGGKAREIPMRNAAQREVVARAHRLAGKGSLIPRDRNYRQQLRDLRAAHGECRPVETAWPAACLRAAAVRRADRVEVAGGGRPDSGKTVPGRTQAGQGGAASDQP